LTGKDFSRARCASAAPARGEIGVFARKFALPKVIVGLLTINKII